MKKFINITWVIFIILFPNSLSGQYQTYIDPDSRSLNTSSMVVGSTAGSFSVNNFGEATYAIPVFCSPGTKGMMPNISIVYNSNYKGGLLGTGWDIAGLSIIQRVQKNYYHENTVDGVDLQSTDRFALDSNRLILINGVYGANLSEYRTEIETFAKITANGIAGTGPSWFKVETKDGNTLEYGNTADSKVEAYGSSTVYQWRVNKITDKFGNYMKFTYNEVNGESYISKIDYTGFSTTQQPYNSLKFVYTQRSDRNFRYVGGSKVPSTMIISEIRMESEGIVAHKYQFKYFVDFLSRTYLNEVIEYGSDGSRFNSTIFGWPTLMSTNFSWGHYSNGVKNIYHFGNFIKEGQTSFIIVPRKTSYYPTDVWKLYSGQTLIYQGQVGEGFSGITVADTDGDGIDNIYIHNRITHTYNCNPHPCGTSMATLSADSISSASVMLIIPPPPADTCWDICTYYDNVFSSYEYNPYQDTLIRESGSDITLLGSPLIYHTMVTDFDGNGKDEIIILDSYNDIYSISGISVYGGYPSFTSPDNIRILDFDGDGRDELLVIKNSNSTIYQYNNTTHQFATIYSSSTFPTKDDRVFIGDFNGDRKDDILSYKSGWSVKYSTGVGFITGSSTPALRTYDPNASILDNNYYIGDFDGDGRSDIAEIYKVSPNSMIRYFYSRGDSFSSAFSYAFDKSNIIQDYFSTVRMDVGEYDKLFYYDYSVASNTPKVVGLLSEAFNPRLKKIYDGLNRKTKITYKNIGFNSLYTWEDYACTYPLVTIMGRYYMVDAVTNSTGVYSGSGEEIEATESYSYEGLRYSKNGKGLMGFGMVKIDESLTQMGVYKTFAIDSTTFYIYPKSIEVRKSAGDLTNSTTNFFAKVDYPNKRIFPYLDSIVQIDVLKTDCIITTREVDTYGNITRIRKNVNSGESIETAEFNYYAAYGNYGIPNKPQSVSTTKTYLNKPSVVSTTNFDYYSNGQIYHEIKRPNSARQLTVTYSYNTPGNLTTTILSAAGLTSKSTTLSYDSKNRYVTSVLEPDGKTSNFEYSGMTGNPTSKTGVDGLTTDYYYDGFGRLALTITPEGHNINSFLIWNTQPQTRPGIYYSFDMVPGRPDVTVYYDRLERPLRTVTDGLQYQVLQDNVYNSDGTLHGTSWPYNPGETVKWTNYSYDDFGRPMTVNNNSLISTYSYDGDTVTITNPSGKSKTSILNGLSNPVQVIEDDNTTITYDYNSFGSLGSITSNGNTISYFYDEFGFQDSIFNAYSGGVKYNYNAFGELVSQKDAKDQQVLFQYDILGRITNLTSPAGTTTYNYYTDGNGIRQLSGISSPGNISEAFSYGTYGRISQYSKSIQNEIQMNYSFGYDSYGNNTSMTYPSGLGIVNVYDANGYLAEIRKTDGSSVWKLNSVKASGLPSMYTLGYNSLNLVKQFNYNSNENLSTITTGNWQQIYNFDDTTGNLMSRSYRDNTNPPSILTETFIYDELDRLTTAQVAGLQSQTVTYSNAGNILSKSGIGNYTYDEDKANSLFSVENTGQIISSEQQLIYYNFLNKPDSITEGNYKYSMVYGADNQRIKSMLMDSTVLNQTKYFGPGYEKIVTPDSTYENHYIASPYGLEAIIVRKDNTERLYYAETDHLGSLIGLISSTGVYVERHSFDPWGRKRNPTDWSYNNVPEPAITDRGFTGHEHLEMFGLINMNGRMYDPGTARFLNVDPILQNPSNSQNFNSYSYCLNNPLKYSDPSGYNYLQYQMDSYYGTGGFYYRGGYKTLNEDGEWEYYRYSLSPGGLASTRDLSYDAQHLEQYHRDVNGNLRDNTGKEVSEAAIYFIAQSLARSTRMSNGESELTYDLIYSDRTGRQFLITAGGMEFYLATNGVLVYISLFSDNSASGGGGWLTPVGGIVDGIGGFGTGMGDLNGSYRLSKGGQLSPKYYSSNWTGGSRARITTYSVAKLGTRISQGAVVVSAGLHVYNINQANIHDGRTFGYNTQVATAQAAGNLLGAWGGAEAGAAAGAAIGVWFGGVGAVPGAIIGGVIGGFLGGWGGSELGGGIVDWFY